MLKLNSTFLFFAILKRPCANYDIINPEKIEEYIAFGGYYSLAKVLQENDKAKVCEEIKNSNLRGRG